MKQFKLTFVLAMLMSMVGLQAFAAWDTSTKIKVNDLYYYLDKDNSQAQVTSMPDGKYTGDIVIPSSITYKAKTYSVTSIGGNAFNRCSGLTSITIPNSVTSISWSAFSDCSGLTSVTIPNSVTIIGSDAFYGCSGLTSVTIPNSVTIIDSRAFYRCSGLTSITIPNSVTSIGDGAFGGCSGLTSIVVESGNTKYDSRDNCNAIIETASNKLVAGCKNTVIPNSVTSIGGGAFKGCSSLTSITIPNSVTSIGGSAFSGCSGLTSVTIPNSVTSIGSYAFSGCSGLTSVTIPNSVTCIEYQAFYGCSGLTSVTIPNSVTSIGDEAFAGCSGLTAVTVLNPTPVAIKQYVFTNRKNATLYVPEGSKEAYQSADYWKEFKEIEEISLPTHKIIYIVDGEVYKTYELKEGESITPEPAPTKEGYTFSGWSEIPATMPADDVIVTGTFEVNKYDLTYSVDGLSKMKMIEPASEHSLTITAEEGWKVVALTVNGEDKMSSLKDNVLTINISADTEVKVTLGWANEANLYTEDPATGIATIEGEGVKVQAKDGQIWVDGAAGKTVRLYTIGGGLMTTVTPTAGNTGKFSVAPGTYIIQVGNKAAKVTVK